MRDQLSILSRTHSRLDPRRFAMRLSLVFAAIWIVLAAVDNWDDISDNLHTCSMQGTIRLVTALCLGTDF